MNLKPQTNMEEQTREQPSADEDHVKAPELLLKDKE